MQLVDQLSRLSLSKSIAAAPAAHREHLCRGGEQQTEFTLTCFHFVAATMRQDATAAVTTLLSYYPSIIFRQLLDSGNPVIVAATAAFLAELAAGHEHAQRYCRLEEVLTKLVSVLCGHATLLQSNMLAPDVQVRPLARSRCSP